MQSSTAASGQLTAPASPLRVVAVHDESGRYRADRYFASGFLFVQEEHADELVQALRTARGDEDYWRELHYVKLTEVDGQWGAKFRTASRWLDAFEAGLLARTIRAGVLLVDCQSPGYDHSRFRRRPHFAYNRFTRMALETGINWMYRGTSTMRLRLVSDGKSRRPGGDDEDPLSGDNFATYLPRAARKRIAGEREWPEVSFSPQKVREVHPGTEHQDCSGDCELVQLADLVVSSTAAAIRGPSARPARKELARRAAGWIRDAGGAPGRRRLNLFRKFSASLFVPGADEAWPKKLPLAVDPEALPGQFGLF